MAESLSNLENDAKNMDQFPVGSIVDCLKSLQSQFNTLSYHIKNQERKSLTEQQSIE